MNTLVLGPVNQVFLLGGGPLLLQFLDWLRSQGARGIVVTSERHAQEQILGSGKAFQQLLSETQTECHVVDNINDLQRCSKLINLTQESIALSFGAAWIFKPETIETIFHNRLFNLHGARLPQDRGGGAFSWQILRGNPFGFCLMHQVDGGVDTGDILAYEEFLYPASCRIPLDYEAHYRAKNLHFLQDLFEKLLDEATSFSLISQPEYLSTYWPRLHTPTHSWIDWSMPVEMLDRFICAFDDAYYGAQTTWNDTPIRLKKSMPAYNDGVFHPFQCGLVYRNNGCWLCVVANGGALIVRSVLDENDRDLMKAIKVGDRFFTPRAKLEEAYKKRVIYTHEGLKG